MPSPKRKDFTQVAHVVFRQAVGGSNDTAHPDDPSKHAHPTHKQRKEKPTRRKNVATK